MRIAFNGLALSATTTGIGRATRQTLRALVAGQPDDEFIALLPADAPDDLGFAAPNLTAVRTEVTLDQPWQSLLEREVELPSELRGATFDVAYAPSYLLPAIPGARANVTCVHDIAWRFHDDLKALLLPSMQRSERVVCVSHATAHALEEAHDGELHLSVVHQGVDLERFQPGSDARNGEVPFIAVVGNQTPGKNIPTLLHAFPAFRARMRPCRLVLAGATSVRTRNPAAVDFVGQLGDEDLVQLYRRALLVVQPSLYEGFGLPVLEAMACGAPVACADIDVFHEITGGCARFFDPKNARAIADTMAELAGDSAARADLSSRGVERAQGFSWAATAAALHDVLRGAAA